MKTQSQINHAEIMGELESIVDTLPNPKKIRTYQIISELYTDFSQILATEQVQGINTGMSRAMTIQARHLGEKMEPIIDINLKLPEQYELFADKYENLSKKIKI